MFIRLLFALLIVSQLSAQDKKFDLLSALKKSKDLILQNPDSAKIHLDQIEYQLSFINTNDSLVAEFYNNYGIYYMQILNQYHHHDLP